MTQAGEQRSGPDVTEVLRATIGQEADYYLEQMRSVSPERFAVIKIGGDTVETDIEPIASDIAMLTSLGLYPVIVHGGGPQINADLEARGIQPRKHNGLRITDEQTLESVENGLNLVNQTIVAALEKRGVAATGVTQGIFTGDYKDRENLQFVGEVERVEVEPIREAIQKGSVPVISCIGQDAEGHLLNINGDTAASALGAALQTQKLIMLTNVQGVLDKDKQLLSVINDTPHAEALIADATITDGMIPKVQKGLEALHALPDDSSVVITDPQHLIRELFTHQGAGTLLRRGDAITHLPSVEAVDQNAVRDLIEAAFGKQLVADYFETLPENAEIFITDRGYRGLAIVLPAENGPAYMDKLVVLPQESGHGVGDEIVDKILEHHPEGVFWRVRKDNKRLPWYRSRGRGQEFDVGDDEWLVFFTKEVKPDTRAQYAAWAILKEQTVLPYENS